MLTLSIVSIAFGLLQVWAVMSVKVGKKSRFDVEGDEELKDIRANDSAQSDNNDQVEAKMVEVAKLISDGSDTFLKQEYLWTSIFVLFFALLMMICVEEKFGQFFTTGPFLIGAITSIISGYIGMQIAVRANIRTAKQATMSLNASFKVAFKGGMVLGFVLVGLALLTLHILILVYSANQKAWFGGTR